MLSYWYKPGQWAKVIWNRDADDVLPRPILPYVFGPDTAKCADTG